jgi:xanthine dehydrogenase accessory factor
MDIYDEIVRLRKLGQKSALATIVQVNGSIPSYESAKMLVREDGSMIGTIGGGCVEAEVWTAAREVIETEKPKHLTFSLGQDAAYDNGLICGGQLNIFIEPVIPQPRAFIFGGGHVSKSISKVANLAGFATVIVDDREAFANKERFPEAEETYADEYEAVFEKLSISSSSYLVIVTRGHRDDMRVLRWAVGTPAKYIAMIGSKRKTISVVRELEKDRRRIAGRDCDIGGRGDDRGAAVARCGLAIAFEVDLRARKPQSAAQVIAGIILAAGASSRMGRPKALLEYRGETFAGRLLRVLSQFCDPVVIVLGYHADAIRDRVAANFVINADPDRGQLSSLQTALATLPDVEGFLFTPVDSPSVDDATLALLVAQFRSRRTIVIPKFNGRRGHPVLIPSELIPEFLSLAPTDETRAIVNRHPEQIVYVDVDDPGILADVDDPAAYQALVQ